MVQMDKEVFRMKLKKNQKLKFRNIGIRPDQDLFLRKHKKEINLSENVRETIDEIMKEWGKLHDK